MNDSRKTTRKKIWPGDSHLFLPLAYLAALCALFIKEWRLSFISFAVLFGLTGTSIAVIALQKQAAEIRAQLDENKESTH